MLEPGQVAVQAVPAKKQTGEFAVAFQVVNNELQFTFFVPLEAAEEMRDNLVRMFTDAIAQCKREKSGLVIADAAQLKSISENGSTPHP